MRVVADDEWAELEVVFKGEREGECLRREGGNFESHRPYKKHDARRTTHDARRTTHKIQRTTHNARRTTHDARRTRYNARRTTHNARRTRHNVLYAPSLLPRP